MFVAETVSIPLPIDEARVRLFTYLRVQGLQELTEQARGEGSEQLVKAGAAGVAKDVLVQVAQPYEASGTDVIPFRWVATGKAGVLFPELDGNLTLTPDTDETSSLELQGAYRPPLARVGGALDRLLLHRVAEATMRKFTRDVASGVLELPDTQISEQDRELCRRVISQART
ncbi:MAG: hypothetical protein GC156_11605 [Actinomycetales bacterium]|nr:hypothetical protein [Actinomycetales bacterium]